MKKYFFEAEVYSGVGTPVLWAEGADYYGELYVSAELAEEMLLILKIAEKQIVKLRKGKVGFGDGSETALQHIRTVIAKAEAA